MNTIDNMEICGDVEICDDVEVCGDVEAGGGLDFLPEMIVAGVALSAVNEIASKPGAQWHTVLGFVVVAIIVGILI